MDTAWIQVFVLTLSECIAPAGKTVCQEREFELQFLTQADCEVALQQLVSLKQSSDNVIVDAGKSRCVASARKPAVAPGPEYAAHQERLSSLPECSDSDGVAPCRIGDIIIEEATSGNVDVWRRDN
jgi:hypothetical protein